MLCVSCMQARNVRRLSEIELNYVSHYDTARSNVLKTLILVCCCFVMCWSWNEFYFLIDSLGYSIDFSSAFYHFTVVAVFSNCCVNPIIYAFKYTEFQLAVKRLAGKQPVPPSVVNRRQTISTVLPANDYY
jgi:hypothetical protein